MESVTLYLDRDTRTAFEREAHAVELSFSAYLRVMARLFREPARWNTPIQEIRERVRQIILEEQRRV